MKILMTGMTSRGIGSQKLKHDYVALSDILARSLVELGHTVDIGRVDPREDLDEYDAALVLVYWVSSLSSHYVHEASLALSKLGKRAAVYVDDWRAQTLADDYYNHVEKPIGWSRHRDRFRKNLWDQLTPEEVELGREALLSMTRPDPAFRMLVPLHPWGDEALFHQSTIRQLTTRITPIDPTPMVPLPAISRRRPEERDRRWVLASIQEHDKWLRDLKPEWPVLQLGGAKKLGGGVNPGRAEMGKVVPEAQVVQAYADSWGMLVPPYASSGSGWWRPRYTFAAHAEAVVLAAPADAARLGDPFLYSLDEVERMEASSLDAVAAWQKAQHDALAWSKERLLETLQEVVSERAASGRTTS